MRVILILLVAIVLMSCTDDDSNDALFSISVVNIKGQAVSGLDVRVSNGYFNDQYMSRAETVIRLSLEAASDVQLNIFDLKDECVRHLVDEYRENGIYSYIWNGNNDAGELAFTGGTNVYRYEATFRDPDTQVITYQQSKYMCLANLTANCLSNIGRTDGNGKFGFSNLLAFPHLFNLEPQPLYDEDANYNGTFTLSNSINIMLIDPLTEEYVVYNKMMLSDESNHYELLWSNQRTDKRAVHSNIPGSYKTNKKDLASIPNSTLSFEVGSVTATVILSSFTAVYFDGTPIIQWTTQSEENNAGWNIYRSEVEDINYGMQINPELILGAGTTILVTEYEFQDEYEVEEGNTYYYWLESIDYIGIVERYGPVSLTIPGEDPDIPIINSFQNFPNPFN